MRAAVLDSSNLWCFSPVGGCLLLLTLMISGCATGKNTTAETSRAAAQASGNAPPSGPEAKISISYSHPGDTLSSLTVTEYLAAETVFSEIEKSGSAAIIRFDGGAPIWQIGVQKKLLTDVPMLSDPKSYAVTGVIYGKVPPNFIATIPDSGPPQPLQPNHYYVFTVVRASGATSYEAVKVNGDGSLEAYAAEPRAGDSFRLCCDIAADFVINANAMTTPAIP
jgi:hypothetical protein